MSTIAIIGAGIGGLTAAALLQRRGHDVHVYEQAKQFARVGAGIQQSANAMRVLRAIGLEERLRSIAFQPASWNNREWDTGTVKYELPLGEVFEQRYGAPYLLLHRGDLHAALFSAVDPARVHLDMQLTGLESLPDGVNLRFANGHECRADAVIGADGVHSLIREWMLGREEPRFTGRVAYRTTFKASLLGGYAIDDCTKWWGPDRHIVIYYITPNRDEVYFVTSLPEPEWRNESWSARGDLGQLRAAFAGFHPQVQAVLEACPEVYKWALYERDPLPQWSKGRVALLGDACHPMVPYMAQGAATAIEDAAVLARCLDEAGEAAIPRAFQRFEATRKARASEIQLTSHRNQWMSKPTAADWVYGYDAWTMPLADVA
ncbi:FAD-dependent monooxygenase [Variovorax sp. Sphag1AA]|uniref:FAD-dependent monooxygenase n=1 Tax=Variovorax sp. Sphag1AA TaxID=2587027 RepID=UPI001611FACD|nr:FAD-dependent monooxygenase [Variovorax sp. Sphag1AA]MBB3177973.1 salicylate hydroxylase/6-hydroxynicotinate 3-monooxygenase [Variovorax sp. Sphag1AA]